jgi:hypothetical protein
MKVISKTIFFSIILFCSYFVQAQEIGVIFSKSVADQKYGEVLNSVEVNTSTLETLLEKSVNYIMFNIKGNNLYILGDGRKSIYPSDLMNVSPDEVFKMASISKVKELLNSGKSSQTFVEQRKNVLSITNGNYTLEEVTACPPMCK